MGNELLALLNMLVCATGIGICVCRMNKMSAKTTKRVIRFQYTLWFGLLFSSLLSSVVFRQFFPEPRWMMEVVQLIFSAGILTHLVSGFPIWKREGLPEYCQIKKDGTQT